LKNDANASFKGFPRTPSQKLYKKNNYFSVHILSWVSIDEILGFSPAAGRRQKLYKRGIIIWSHIYRR
jgi:hypothetical protein